MSQSIDADLNARYRYFLGFGEWQLAEWTAVISKILVAATVWEPSCRWDLHVVRIDCICRDGTAGGGL